MIKFRVRKRPKDLEQAISDMPRNARGIASEAAAVYIVGNNRRGLKHYAKRRPNQKYVRTYELRRGWKAIEKGAESRVENKVHYARYVQGEKQAWMHAGRWRTWKQVVKDNTKGMLRAADQALQRWLKKRGLS